MQPLRVYLISAGAIARHHANALSNLPVDQITLSVTDTNPEVLADFVQQFPHARLAPHVATLLAEPPTPMIVSWLHLDPSPMPSLPARPWKVAATCCARSL